MGLFRKKRKNIWEIKKADEFVIADVRVSVEELALCSFAHRVESEADLTQKFFGEKRFASALVLHIFFLGEFIEVCHDGVIRRFQLAVIGVIRDATGGVQLADKDFNRVDMSVREVLVGAEKVLEEGDMLGQSRCLSEGFRRILVYGFIVRPRFRLEGIDDILSAHEVDITAAEVVAEILVFLLGIQADDRLSGHSRVGQNEF